MGPCATRRPLRKAMLHKVKKRETATVGGPRRRTYLRRHRPRPAVRRLGSASRGRLKDIIGPDDEPITDANVGIVTYDSGVPINSGTINENGQATFKLRNGSYAAEVGHEVYAQPSDDRGVVINDADVKRTIQLVRYGPSDPSDEDGSDGSGDSDDDATDGDEEPGNDSENDTDDGEDTTGRYRQKG